MSKLFPIQSEYFDYDGRWNNNPPHSAQYRVPFPRNIPWEDAEKAYKVYSRHYGDRQTLERMAERGGFGGYEFVMYFYDLEHEDDTDFWDHGHEYMGAYVLLRGL